MASVRLLPALPSMPRLYARALLASRGRDISSGLPDQVWGVDDVRVDLDELADYSRVCGFPLTGALPATFPHVLAFGLQLALMAARDFPLALPGMVHVRNVITQHRPIDGAEHLSIRVGARRLQPHPKGASVELVAEVSVGDELVWEAVSTYLSRGVTVPGQQTPIETAPQDSTLEVSMSGSHPTQQWQVGADAGRRYAAVSGDVNPIHLSGLAAKSFGFPRAIAHGMWTAARSLSTVHAQLPPSFTQDVRFEAPVLLPSRSELFVGAVAGGWDMTLARPRDGRRQLSAAIRATA